METDDRRIIVCKKCGREKYIRKGLVCEGCYSALPHRRAAQDRAHKKTQAETLPSATNNGKHWTSAEDEIVLDPNLSLEAKAKRLGRTYFSVTCRHYRLTGKSAEQGDS